MINRVPNWIVLVVLVVGAFMCLAGTAFWIELDRVKDLTGEVEDLKTWQSKRGDIAPSDVQRDLDKARSEIMRYLHRNLRECPLPPSP